MLKMCIQKVSTRANFDGKHSFTLTFSIRKTRRGTLLRIVATRSIVEVSTFFLYVSRSDSLIVPFVVEKKRYVMRKG